MLRDKCRNAATLAPFAELWRDGKMTGYSLWRSDHARIGGFGLAAACPRRRSSRARPRPTPSAAIAAPTSWRNASSVKPGGIEAIQCLKKNDASLSAACRVGGRRDQAAGRSAPPPAAPAAPSPAAAAPRPAPAAAAPTPRRDEPAAAADAARSRSAQARAGQTRDRAETGRCRGTARARPGSARRRPPLPRPAETRTVAGSRAGAAVLHHRFSGAVQRRAARRGPRDQVPGRQPAGLVARLQRRDARACNDADDVSLQRPPYRPAARPRISRESAATRTGLSPGNASALPPVTPICVTGTPAAFASAISVSASSRRAPSPHSAPDPRRTRMRAAECCRAGVELRAEARRDRHFRERDRKPAVGNVMRGGDAAGAISLAHELAMAFLSREIDRRRRALFPAADVAQIERLAEPALASRRSTESPRLPL